MDIAKLSEARYIDKYFAYQDDAPIRMPFSQICDQLLIDPVLDRAVKADNRLRQYGEICRDRGGPIERAGKQLMIDAVRRQKGTGIPRGFLLEQRSRNRKHGIGTPAEQLLCGRDPGSVHV